MHYDNVKFISGIKVLFLIGNPFLQYIRNQELSMQKQTATIIYVLYMYTYMNIIYV